MNFWRIRKAPFPRSRRGLCSGQGRNRLSVWFVANSTPCWTGAACHKATSYLKPHSTRYLSTSAVISSSTDNVGFLEIPRRASPEEKMRFVVENVPAGLMDPSHIEFCQSCIFDHSKAKLKNKGLVIERILERLELEASIRGAEGILSAQDYARTIRIWARTDPDILPPSSDPPFLRAKAVLDRMLDFHRKRPNAYPAPDIFVYDAVIFACTRARHTESQEAVKIAVDLLESLEKDVLENPDTAVFPTTTTYNNVFDLYSKIAGQVYGAATAAEDLLMHFSKLSADGILDVKPDTYSFNCVLNAWSESAEDKGADRALEILRFILSVGDEHERVRPDAMSFGSVISAFGRRKRPDEATEVYIEAVDYFAKLLNNAYLTKEEEDKGKAQQQLQVDLTGCLNAVLTAWAYSGDPRAREKAESLFLDAQNYNDRHSFRVQPDSRSYRMIVNAQLASGHESDIKKAHQNLLSMISSFEKGHGPPPDRDIFHSVLGAFATIAARPNIAADGEELLKSMIRLSKKHRLKCTPVASTFTRCIRLWTKQPYDRTSASHVIELLRMAENRRMATRSMYEIAINFLAQPWSSLQAALFLERMSQNSKEDFKSEEGVLAATALHTKVILALSRVKSPLAAEHAVLLLRSMQSMGLGISSRTYTAVAAAFSKERSQQAVDRVLLLLEELKQADADPTVDLNFQDPIIFAIALEQLSSVGSTKNAEKACNILNEMFQMSATGRTCLEPDERCLDACLKALCACNDSESVKRGVQLLKAMSTKQNQSGSVFLPSTRGIKHVLECCIRHGLEEEMEQVNMLLQQKVKFLANFDGSGGPDDGASHRERVNAILADPENDDAVIEADSFLKEMVAAFEDGKGPAPDQRIFHSVIDGWVNSNAPEAALKAEELLLTMIRLRNDLQAPTSPAKSTFDRCILSWTKHPYCAESAEHVANIFSLAEERRAVNLYMYRSVINYLAKCSSVMEAATILERITKVLDRDYVKKEESGFRFLYCKVLSALAKTKTEIAADRALGLFKQMKDLKIEMDSFVYTHVVAAFTHEKSRRQYAADVSCSMLDELMRADADPDSEIRFHDSLIFDLVLNNLKFVKTPSAANQACQILNEMFRLYGEGRSELEPTSRSLGNCLATMYSTGDKRYIQGAVELFRSMVTKQTSKGLPFLPEEQVASELAKSCAKVGLTTESNTVMKLWNEYKSKSQ